MRKRRKQKKQLARTIHEGHRLIAAGGEREAFEFLDNAARRFPEDPEVRLLYATSLLGVRPNDAVPEAVKAIELEPDEPIRLTRAANLLFNMGEIRTARAYAKQARELTNTDFLFYPELVHLESHFAVIDGNYELAEEGFRFAAEREPEQEMFAHDLAKFLVGRNRAEEALAVVDDALARSKRPEALARLRNELTGGSG